jgi:NodT family efflux transporter outer membrane factor (OMF) lipoprotein
MKPSIGVVVLWSALALQGCAFAPHRLAHPPPVGAASLGLADAPVPALAERWWQAFGDARLDALVAQATRDNPSLGEALARLERARAEAVAAGSARAPHLEASSTVLRERYSARYIIPPPYGGGSYWDSQLDLGLSYDLDLWGRQAARIRAAERSVDAREFEARAATLAIEGAVVSAYVELDRRYAVAELAHAAEDTRAALATLTRRRVAAGLDTGIDRRSADAAIPESRTDREQAAAAIDLSVHRLAALTGQGAAAYAGIGRPSLAYEGALPLPAVIPGDLLARRPDVQAARARIGAATASEDAARLAAYPEINLQAFAGFAALTLRDLLSAPARTYGLGPAVRLPIFDAGLLRAQYRGAGADLEATVAQYNATVLDAVREVADAITTVEALGRERKDADERLALLVEAERLAGERFRGGLTNQLAVLEANARVIAARRVLVGTRALEAEARVALAVALGGGVQPALAAPQASAKALQ